MGPKSIRDAATPILIVDDNLQYSEILKRVLGQGMGYSNITAVHSTAEAFELLSREPQRFSLLFVDYRFPEGETGGELLERLKSERLLSDKVAFLITSEPNVDNQRQALNAGARGVVAKPFNRKVLEEQLEKAQRSLDADQNESF